MRKETTVNDPQITPMSNTLPAEPQPEPELPPPYDGPIGTEDGT